MKRYPLQRLLDLMDESPNQACLKLGLSGSTQQEYRRIGVTERVADRLAVRAGFVTYEVWPEMVDDLIASVELVCGNETCGERFVPVRRDQVACSPLCARAVRIARRRARYHTDPSVRAERKANAARYYAENRDYVRNRQRRARSRPLPASTQENER